MQVEKEKKEKQVQIPESLFKNTLYMLEYLDVSSYSEDFQSIVESVKNGFILKQKAIKASEAYGKYVQANKTNDEGEQFDARVNYFKAKKEKIDYMDM